MAEFRALKATLLQPLTISRSLLYNLKALACLHYPNPANQSRKRSPMPVV